MAKNGRLEGTIQAQADTHKKTGKHQATAALPHSQALQEMREAEHAAASLGGRGMGSPRHSETHSDQESMLGSAYCSSLEASESLPQITPGTSDEIL
ncbi:hypothetical protein NDU88_000016 [Pleurodeles waltl]|uniref:Uncharacterized protein n=1 Tax=Pleurodeles waltl TaxID=8319 RepID=A0AAV7TDS6_PLEWA|nr:hypothetical protein NDU88_000016 [Pleurodeles waltl]